MPGNTKKTVESPRRAIRSFVRRSGRLTPGQQRALDVLWLSYGIDYTPQPLDLQNAFGQDAPTVLEIGFGNGETLVAQAAENRDTNYLGVEIHEPGIGHCLMQAKAAGITNLRIVRNDAIDVLQQQIPDAGLGRINLYFPDPWPKKRHHKRRIIQPPFLELCARKLGSGGALHVATDWRDYAGHIDEVIAQTAVFRVAERREHGGGRALDRPTTKFERRGLRKGHRIVDWLLLKN